MANESSGRNERKGAKLGQRGDATHFFGRALRLLLAVIAYSGGWATLQGERDSRDALLSHALDHDIPEAPEPLQYLLDHIHEYEDDLGEYFRYPEVYAQ